jgi:hypothetical protein
MPLKFQRAFGFHQSRYGWSSIQDMDYVIEMYEMYRIPVDGKKRPFLFKKAIKLLWIPITSIITIQ